MLLTEQHILPSSDTRFAVVDLAAFAAKNLYNAANYLVRQSFIKQNLYLNYYHVHALMKSHEAYRELPRKVSQQVLRILHQNWQSFFQALRAWQQTQRSSWAAPDSPNTSTSRMGGLCWSTPFRRSQSPLSSAV